MYTVCVYQFPVKHLWGFLCVCAKATYRAKSFVHSLLLAYLNFSFSLLYILFINYHSAHCAGFIFLPVIYTIQHYIENASKPYICLLA